MLIKGLETSTGGPKCPKKWVQNVLKMGPKCLGPKCPGSEMA